MIDLDDIMSSGDEERRDPRAVEALGLVVAEKAPSGNALIAETQCYLETSKLPFVIFIEEDENGSALFANAAEFQQAMDLMRAPTEEEALAWSAEHTGAAFKKWRARIDAAYLMDRPDGGAAARPRILNQPACSPGRPRVFSEIRATGIGDQMPPQRASQRLESPVEN